MKPIATKMSNKRCSNGDSNILYPSITGSPRITFFLKIKQLMQVAFYRAFSFVNDFRSWQPRGACQEGEMKPAALTAFSKCAAIGTSCCQLT